MINRDHIQTTHVGSLPRSAAVADLLFAQERGESIAAEEAEAILTPAVAHIVFVVNSFSGQNFSQIENATARVVDSADRDREFLDHSIAELEKLEPEEGEEQTLADKRAAMKQFARVQDDLDGLAGEVVHRHQRPLVVAADVDEDRPQRLTEDLHVAPSDLR